jgi:hypothetical protein
MMRILKTGDLLSALDQNGNPASASMPGAAA